jgi:hypothetical protein
MAVDWLAISSAKAGMRETVMAAALLVYFLVL